MTKDIMGICTHMYKINISKPDLWVSLNFIIVSTQDFILEMLIFCQYFQLTMATSDPYPGSI